jgi:hypothetical protein
MAMSCWKSSAALVVVLMGCGAYKANSQSSPSEPFTPINRSQLPSGPSSIQLQRLDHIEHLSTTKAVYVYRMLPGAQIGDQINISLPNGTTFMLHRTGGENHDSKDFTWFGELQGVSRGTATLISHNGEIMGSINSAQDLYRIASLGNGAYAFVKVSTRGLSPDEPPAKN